MDCYGHMFAVKCGDKYFAGFKPRAKDGKLVPRFIGKRQLQDDYTSVAIESLVEAKALCKALLSKYCVKPEGEDAKYLSSWTITVISESSTRFVDIGTIWSAAD